jgi:hypothetical protein
MQSLYNIRLLRSSCTPSLEFLELCRAKGCESVPYCVWCWRIWAHQSFGFLAFESVIAPARCLCWSVSFLFYFFFFPNVTLRSSRMSTSIVDLDLYEVRACALAFWRWQQSIQKSSSSSFIFPGSPRTSKNGCREWERERWVRRAIYLRNCESRGEWRACAGNTPK